MSISVPTMREELQMYWEENYEQQLEIDKLVVQRDDAMDDIQDFLNQYEHWKKRAEYWEVRYKELRSRCECVDARNTINDLVYQVHFWEEKYKNLRTSMPPE